MRNTKSRRKRRAPIGNATFLNTLTTFSYPGLMCVIHQEDKPALEKCMSKQQLIQIHRRALKTGSVKAAILVNKVGEKRCVALRFSRITKLLYKTCKAIIKQTWNGRKFQCLLRFWNLYLLVSRPAMFVPKQWCKVSKSGRRYMTFQKRKMKKTTAPHLHQITLATQYSLRAHKLHVLYKCKDHE